MNMNVVQHVQQTHYILINNIRWDIITYVFQTAHIIHKDQKIYAKKLHHNKETKQIVHSMNK